MNLDFLRMRGHPVTVIRVYHNDVPHCVHPSCITLLSNEGSQRKQWRNANSIGHFPQLRTIIVIALHMKH